MKKKMMKAIKELNTYIDNDREKLCDRVHELELSYKRMERLLGETLRFFNKLYNSNSQCLITWSDIDKLCFKIKNELSYPYFRVNYKMKGGKDA